MRKLVTCRYLLNQEHNRRLSISSWVIYEWIYLHYNMYICTQLYAWTRQRRLGYVSKEPAGLHTSPQIVMNKINVLSIQRSRYIIIVSIAFDWMPCFDWRSRNLEITITIYTVQTTCGFHRRLSIRVAPSCRPIYRFRFPMSVFSCCLSLDL